MADSGVDGAVVDAIIEIEEEESELEKWSTKMDVQEYISKPKTKSVNNVFKVFLHARASPMQFFLNVSCDAQAALCIITMHT